jgi:signal transduction histidine kinase
VQGSRLTVSQMTDASPPQQSAAATPEAGVAAAGESAELARLRQALRTSEAKRRELDEFISLLAHDLRTPLTSIRGYAQLLLRQRAGHEPLVPAVAGGLKTIIEQTDRLAAQTELLLDVSRVRLNRVALVTREVDLGMVVKSALVRFSAGIAPFLDQSGPGGIRVMGDFERLRRTVHLLLEFGLSHGAHAGDVTVSLAQCESNGVVSIDAPGDVLDAEAQRDLFTRLYDPSHPDAVERLKPSALYIASGLAEAHGGGIDAMSPLPGEEGGVRLTLKLPLAVPAA